MIKKDASKVKQAIRKYEKEGVILKYKAVINKELIREEDSDVRALIGGKYCAAKGLRL